MPHLKGGPKTLGALILFIAVSMVAVSSHLPAPAGRDIIIEVHDASPLWGTEGLDSILAVLREHRVARTVIFVIPNHGGDAPLGDHRDLVDRLKELQDEGYVIGAHGYTHEGLEFYCSGEDAVVLVERTNHEFERAGLEPTSFFPPRYLVSYDALKVLEDNYDRVFLLTRIYDGDHILPYRAHEFTFGLPPWTVLPLAKTSYVLNRDPVYRLTLHVDYASSENSLRTLDSFLTWTDG